MTKSEKRASLVLELTEIKLAISNIRNGGQSYTISSGSSGTSRTVTQANYKDLLTEKYDLEGELSSLDNQRATRMRAAW